jgi:hypothetical protein
MAARKPALRRFRVQARDCEDHHGRVVEECTFEAAVAVYVEDHAGGAGELTLMVRDLESGHDHCFRIDLASGETASCD